MGIYTEAVQKLYVAYFSRPADTAGLTYWENVVTAAKGNTAAVSAAFAASQEYKDTFAGQSAYQVINTIYQNLFGRPAEPAALTFWGQGLLAGNFTIDNAVTSIAAGAQGTDKTAYANKVAAATAFTAALDTSEEILGYSGAAANVAAKSFLAGITTDASLTTAIEAAALNASVSGVVNAGLDALGKSFNLTSGVDAMVGTAGNDVFNATISGATPTFSAFDSINGAGGTNTLNIVDTSTSGQISLPSSVTISNIQNVNVSTVSSGGASIDASAIAGVTSVKLNTTDTTGTAVDVVKANAASTVSVTSAGGSVAVDGGTSVTVNAKGAVTIGSATAPTGAVNVTTSSVASTGNNTAGAITIKGGTTVNVTENLAAPTPASTAVGAFNTTGGAVTVTGTAATTSVNVTQTAAVASVTGVAAAAAVPAVAQVDTVTIAGTVTTGDVFTVTVNSTPYSYTAIAGDTTVEVAAGLRAAINAAGVTDGGTGSSITLTAAVAGTAFTASASTNSTTATNTSANTTANAAAVAAVTAKAPVGGIINGAVSITDLNSANTDGTKANTITSVKLDGYGAGSVINSNALTSLTLANSAKDVTVNDKTATPTNTTLALSVNNLGAGASLTDNTIKTLDITSGAAASTLAVNATAATKVTATGASKLTLDLTGATKLATVDAATATGAIALSGLANTVTSVTTGAGADTVTLNTQTKAAVAATSTTAAVAAVNATVSTGAGADTIDVRGVTGTGNFSVNAGAGNDIIKVNQSQLVAGNVIDGGADADTLVLGNNTSVAFAAGDYALINSLVSNIETIEFTGNVVGVDASKVAFTSMIFDNGGTVTGVGTQSLTTATGLNATASGYVAGSAYAGNLNVTQTGSGTLVLNADTATVNVKASTSAATVSTINGDLQTSLTVKLSNSANNATASSATGDNLASATIAVNNTQNTALKSIVLSGPGSVTIDASASKALTSVDASQLGGTIANGTTKGAITGGLTFTGNTAIAETITLGSGRDTINAGSTYGKMDSIVSFDAVKEGSTNASTSDVLVISAAQIGGGAGTLTLNGLTAPVAPATTVAGITKLTLGAADNTLDLAFVKAAASAAAGTVVQFQFEGNTYLFADTNGNNTLDNSDFAIKLVGTVDLTGGFGLPPATV